MAGVSVLPTESVSHVSIARPLKSALAGRRGRTNVAPVVTKAGAAIMGLAGCIARPKDATGPLACGTSSAPVGERRRSVRTFLRSGSDLRTPKSARCITPYNMIYGRPPSHFNFDRSGNMKITPEGMEAEMDGFVPESPKVGALRVVSTPSRTTDSDTGSSSSEL